MASTSVKPGHEAREQTAPYDADVDVYKMLPHERIQLIRKGIAAQRIDALCATLHIPKETLLKALGMARATINRKAQRGIPLSSDETERVLGFEYLLGQVRRMTAQGSGDPEYDNIFDAGQWLGWWLTTPLPALGEVRPIEYFDTIEGQKFISNLMSMAESGGYA